MIYYVSIIKKKGSNLLTFKILHQSENKAPILHQLLLSIATDEFFCGQSLHEYILIDIGERCNSMQFDECH